MREMLAVVAMSIRVATSAATVRLIRVHEFRFVILGGGPIFSGADDRILGTSEAGGGIGSSGSRGGPCSRR